MIYRYLLAIYAILAMTGCASVVNEVTHPMKVETMTSDNVAVSGANCKLTNDRQSITMKSGDTVKVRRSADDMEIACTHPNNPALKAIARAISRANGGMYGNIILGGVIGAVIDHNKGTAYTYPTWVQLVFDQKLIFDRTAQKEKDQPTPPTNHVVSPAVVAKPAEQPGKGKDISTVADKPAEKSDKEQGSQAVVVKPTDDIDKKVETVVEPEIKEGNDKTASTNI